MLINEAEEYKLLTGLEVIKALYTAKNPQIATNNRNTNATMLIHRLSKLGNLLFNRSVIIFTRETQYWLISYFKKLKYFLKSLFNSL